MSRKYNNLEQVLLCELGVYGLWLLKFAKNLEYNDEVDILMRLYLIYHRMRDNYAIEMLMIAIDRYCDMYSFHTKPYSLRQELISILDERKVR